MVMAEIYERDMYLVVDGSLEAFDGTHFERSRYLKAEVNSHAGKGREVGSQSFRQVPLRCWKELVKLVWRPLLHSLGVRRSSQASHRYDFCTSSGQNKLGRCPVSSKF